jgi:hypothetical protein
MTYTFTADRWGTKQQACLSGDRRLLIIHEVVTSPVVNNDGTEEYYVTEDEYIWTLEQLTDDGAVILDEAHHWFYSIDEAIEHFEETYFTYVIEEAFI